MSEPRTAKASEPAVRLAAGALLVILGLGAGAAIWLSGPTPKGWAPVFLRTYFAVWICFAAAALMVTRVTKLPKWALVWIILVALGLRVVALAHTPHLSTDVWRYLWDGRVANAGINPYRYAPDAPQLQDLRDRKWRYINHKHISTIYPPTAQILFAALARVHDSDPKLLRWTFGVADMATVLVLMALLARTGRRREQVIWYAWCPLPITEFTGGAHVDAVGVLLLTVSLWLAARDDRRPGAASAVALAASALTKGFAVLLLPFFVRRAGFRYALWFALACLVLSAPFLSAGRHLLDGLTVYMEKWEANAGLFIFADRWLEQFTPDHFVITRRASMLAVLAVVAVLIWRQRPGVLGIIGAGFVALAAQLLLGAPTLPWYVAWSAPFLCWWAIPGWVVFTLTVSVQYYLRFLYSGNEVAQFAFLKAGYSIVYVMLAVHLFWWWARKRPSAAADGEAGGPRAGVRLRDHGAG